MIGGVMVEVLANLGYDVCAIATTEGGAVSAAARYKPDLMILDIALADGTGPSAMERISQSGPIPHMFISGNVFQVTAPGAVLLRKPFLQGDLVQAIGRALGATGVQGPTPAMAPPAASA